MSNHHPADLIERVAKALWTSDPQPESEKLWPYHVNGIVQEKYRRLARAALTEAGAWIVEARSSDSGTSDAEARQADARIANKAIQVSRTEFSYYRPKE